MEKIKMLDSGDSISSKTSSFFERCLTAFSVAGIFVLILARALVDGIVNPDFNIRVLVFSLVLLFIVSIRLIMSEKIRVRISSFFLIGLLYFAWTLLCSFKSVNKYNSFLYMINITGYLLIYFAATNFDKKGRYTNYLITAVVLAGVLVSFFGIYQYFFGFSQTREWLSQNIGLDLAPGAFKNRLESNRVFSTFVYPNALGGYLLLILPLSIAYYLELFKIEKSKRLNNFLILFIILSVFAFILLERKMMIAALAGFSIFPFFDLTALTLTGSKGAFAAAIIVLFIVTTLFFLKNTKTKYALVLATVLISSILFILLHNGNKILTAQRYLESLVVRVEYWISAFDMIRDRPIFGSGPGTFGDVFAGYKMSYGEETRMAHNNYLQVAVETGLPGLMLYVILWFSLIFTGYRTLKSQKYSWIILGIWLGILGFLIHSLFDFDYYVPGIAATVWILAAIMHNERTMFIEYNIQVFSKAKRLFWIAIFWIIACVGILFCRKCLEASAFKEKGFESLKNNDYASAEIYFSKAKDIIPFDNLSIFYLGQIAFALSDYEKAIYYQKLACEKNSLSAMMRYKLAQMYSAGFGHENKGNLQKIIHALKSAARNYPSKDLYHFDLARFYEIAGDYALALKGYREALNFSDKEPVIMSRIKKILREKKDKI